MWISLGFGDGCIPPVGPRIDVEQVAKHRWALIARVQPQIMPAPAELGYCEMHASPIEAGSGQARKTGRSRVCGSGVAVGRSTVTVAAREIVGGGDRVSSAATARVRGTGVKELFSALPQAEKIRRPITMNGESCFKNVLCAVAF